MICDKANKSVLKRFLGRTPAAGVGHEVFHDEKAFLSQKEISSGYLEKKVEENEGCSLQQAIIAGEMFS